MWNKMKNNVNVSMEKAIDSLKHQLSKIRTGRATDSVLDGITVDYYGMSSPIKQVGQVSIPEARLL